MYMAAVLLDSPTWILYVLFMLGQPMGIAILFAGVVTGMVGCRCLFRLPVQTGGVLGLLSGFAVPAIGYPWLPDLYRSVFWLGLPAVSAVLALGLCWCWPWFRRAAVRLLRLSPP